MNEQELKEIWKTTDSQDLPEIDFEAVKKNIAGWHDKLRRKIKIDILINVLFYIAVIPAFIAYPKILYFAPLIIIIWIWYLWELLRIYKHETASADGENTKEFLKKKTRLLTGYIWQTRVIAYSITPFLVIAALLVNTTFKKLLENAAGIFLLILVFEILVLAIVEIYIRIIYFPSIKKSRELIKQLESE